MSRALTFEVLYPEIANLHGDAGNITYLSQSRPDARLIRTALTDVPAFVAGHVDLVYLGAMTERSQLIAIERLAPYRARIAELIGEGILFLFTHNAFEVLGTRIRNDELGYDVAGVGVFPFETTVAMSARYNGKVMGLAQETSAEHPVVGYKSQFSTVVADDALPGFLVADRGIGRHPGTAVEGVRSGGFIGTSLIGPLLVMNPHLARALLARIDPDSDPSPAHEQLAVAAYEARLAEFRDPRRWHPFERVTPERPAV